MVGLDKFYFTAIETMISVKTDVQVTLVNISVKRSIFYVVLCQCSAIDFDPLEW